MNPFSRSDWKREARKASQGKGGPGWQLAAVLVVIALVVTFVRSCG